MKKNITVATYTLGSLLDEYTLNAINNAKQITKVQQERKGVEENKFINSQGEMVESTLHKMNEIKYILKQAGISVRYFPFTPIKNRNGEIEGFVPKSDDISEIKKDIDLYKEKIQEVFDKGKIDQEEFEKLNQNLDELIEENKIDLEEAEELEVTDAEINDYLNAVIYRNFGNNYDLDDIKEKYEEADIDSKEAFLSKFNSEINKKIGISGTIGFSQYPMSFSNSFNSDGKGITLSQDQVDVKAEDLKNILYGMVERGLMRKHELGMGQQMTPQKREIFHNKIMQDKQKREQERQRKEDNFNKEQARKKIRLMENSKGGF